MNTKLTALSKFVSFVLRHRPESIGLVLDAQGWADLDALVVGAQKKGEPLSRENLQAIIASNDKQRFQVSDDGRHIRAVQGHSSPQVSVSRPAKRPPAVLYHGTADRFVEAINKQSWFPESATRCTCPPMSCRPRPLESATAAWLF